MTATGDDLATIRRWALIVTMALIPIERGVVLTETPGLAGGYNRIGVALFADVALALFAITAYRRIRMKPRGLVQAIALLLPATGAVAWIVHPSLAGFIIIVRLTAIAVLVLYVAGLTTGRFRREVTLPFGVSVAVQAIIGYAQLATGGPIGLGSFGERPRLFEFGGVTAAQGTTIHPYVLAGCALVAGVLALHAAVSVSGRSRRWWMLLMAVDLSIVGVTFGRTVALAALLVVTAAAVGWAVDRNARVAASVLIVALGLPALVWFQGWQPRIDATTDATSLDAASSRRGTLITQAWGVIGDHPLVGVGPGRYTIVLEARYEPEKPDAAHAVPVHVAAEHGLYAGVLLAGLILALGFVSVRAGWVQAATFAALGPFLLLDKFPYLHPNGLIVFGVWLAGLDLLRRYRASPASEEHAGRATA